LDKRAEQILAKFKKAKAKRTEKDTLWKELDAFDRNQQWELSNKLPSWMPKPVTNFVHLVKYTKRAALAMENPTGKLRATSPNDVPRMEELQRAYEFVWDKIRARKVIRQNIETAKLLGTGIAQVYWDENVEGRLGSTVLGGTGSKYEGEIRIKEVDPGCFYPDPSAFTIEDCQFIHIVERKPMEWLKKHPLFGKGLKDQKETNDSPDSRGEIYHRDYGVGSDGLIDFHQHFEKIPNPNGGFTYKVTYLAGENIVHVIEKLQPNRYPFAILQDFPQRQDFWAKSTCEFILDNQKIINKVESIIAMIGTLMQNPQKIVSKESGINPKEVAKFGNAPGHTFTANGDPNRAMVYVQPPQIPTVLFNLLETAKQNIREITGLTEAYMGQTVGSLQTSGGIDSLIERATMRDRDQMYDVELYIEQLSSLIIDFIVTNYTEPRMIRILGEQPDQYHFQEFLGVAYQDLEFDFFIDVSAKAPVTRMKEAQEAKELLNLQGQYQFAPAVIKPQEYIKLANYTNKDQLIQRMNAEEQQNKLQEITNITNMVVESVTNGVPPEEVIQMATSMFEQMDAGKGTGSTANENNIQQRQSGVGL
jgi:hypothetical protein